MAAQKSASNARELLQHAYTQEPNEKAALFRIIGEIADAAIVPELHQPPRGQGPDRAHRTSSTSWRASTGPRSRAALQTQLKDPNKLMRQAALNALATHGRPRRRRP